MAKSGAKTFQSAQKCTKYGVWQCHGVGLYADRHEGPSGPLCVCCLPRIPDARAEMRPSSSEIKSLSGIIIGFQSPTLPLAAPNPVPAWGTVGFVLQPVLINCAKTAANSPSAYCGCHTVVGSPTCMYAAVENTHENVSEKNKPPAGAGGVLAAYRIALI